MGDSKDFWVLAPRPQALAEDTETTMPKVPMLIMADVYKKLFHPLAASPAFFKKATFRKALTKGSTDTNVMVVEDTTLLKKLVAKGILETKAPKVTLVSCSAVIRAMRALKCPKAMVDDMVFLKEDMHHQFMTCKLPSPW